MTSNPPRPQQNNGYIAFPAYHMRGGTSTGLVLWKEALPSEQDLLEELIRHLMGTPLSGETRGNKQITGLGRGIPTSNKVFIVSHEPAENRIVSTLAQLAADKSEIDWSVNCGNMSSAIPLFAHDVGWLKTGDAFGEIAIYNTNTRSTMDARLLLQSGRLVSNTQIPGVHGTFPGVDLFLRNPVGSKTGTLFPTGHPADRIGDMDVTCIDVAVPMVIVKASAFGKSGHESPKELDADTHFKEALRALWVEAGLRMELRKRDGTLMSAHDIAHSETIPKVCLVSPADSGGHIKARYFTPQSAHPSLAVSGGCCLASACLIPGTVAHAVATATASAPLLEASLKEFNIAVENPAGLLDTVIEARHADDTIHIAAAAYRRSAQILLKGMVPLYHCSDALFSALSKKAHH